MSMYACSSKASRINVSKPARLRSTSGQNRRALTPPEILGMPGTPRLKYPVASKYGQQSSNVATQLVSWVCRIGKWEYISRNIVGKQFNRRESSSLHNLGRG